MGKNHYYHLPPQIFCDAGTQPVPHKYCLSDYPVLAFPDTLKVSTWGIVMFSSLKTFPWLFFPTWWLVLLLFIVSPSPWVSVLFLMQKTALQSKLIIVNDYLLSFKICIWNKCLLKIFLFSSSYPPCWLTGYFFYYLSLYRSASTYSRKYSKQILFWSRE